MSLSLFVWLALLPLAGQAEGLAADKIFIQGRIATMDAGFRTVQALAVRDGKLVAVGSNAEIRRHKGATTEEVDLGGKTVLPGLIDTHLHLEDDPYSLDLEKVQSLAELKRVLRKAAAGAATGSWVRGRAWSEDHLEERRRPTRRDLDEVAPHHPVYLWRAGGHSGVANSLALKLAGTSSDTRDPEGGIIERDANGEPTGVLRETAQGLVARLIPPLTEADRRKGYLESLRALHPWASPASLRPG